MKIEINDKSYKIKPFNELTVKEYKNFFVQIKEQTYVDVFVSYLSVMTGLSTDSLRMYNIDDLSIKRIFSYMGKIVAPQDIPNLKSFYLKSANKTISNKDIKWRTLGVRKFLEEKKDITQIEQSVYLLSVCLSSDYDNEKIEEIYTELQDYRAYDVLGFIFFFSRKLLNGQKSGINFLSLFLRKLKINTVKLSSK